MARKSSPLPSKTVAKKRSSCDPILSRSTPINHKESNSSEGQYVQGETDRFWHYGKAKHLDPQECRDRKPDEHDTGDKQDGEQDTGDRTCARGFQLSSNHDSRFVFHHSSMREQSPRYRQM